MLLKSPLGKIFERWLRFEKMLERGEHTQMKGFNKVSYSYESLSTFYYKTSMSHIFTVDPSLVNEQCSESLLRYIRNTIEINVYTTVNKEVTLDQIISKKDTEDSVGGADIVLVNTIIDRVEQTLPPIKERDASLHELLSKRVDEILAELRKFIKKV